MMYLNTDHSRLNKFSEDDNPSFKVISLVIEKTIWEIPQINLKTNNFQQKIDIVKLLIAKSASFNLHIEEHSLRCLANIKMEL